MSNQKIQGQVPALPLTGCVSLRRLGTPPEPQVPHLVNIRKAQLVRDCELEIGECTSVWVLGMCRMQWLLAPLPAFSSLPRPHPACRVPLEFWVHFTLFLADPWNPGLTELISLPEALQWASGNRDGIRRRQAGRWARFCLPCHTTEGWVAHQEAWASRAAPPGLLSPPEPTDWHPCSPLSWPQVLAPSQFLITVPMRGLAGYKEARQQRWRYYSLKGARLPRPLQDPEGLQQWLEVQQFLKSPGQWHKADVNIEGDIVPAKVLQVFRKLVENAIETCRLSGEPVGERTRKVSGISVLPWEKKCPLLGCFLKLTPLNWG